MKSPSCAGLTQARRFSRERVYAELGEVIAGMKPGRERDGERIYVPVENGLLLISKDGVQMTTNIENPDSVMVTPADGQKPFENTTLARTAAQA